MSFYSVILKFWYRNKSHSISLPRTILWQVSKSLPYFQERLQKITSAILLLKGKYIYIVTRTAFSLPCCRHQWANFHVRNFINERTKQYRLSVHIKWMNTNNLRLCSWANRMNLNIFFMFTMATVMVWLAICQFFGFL